MCSKDSDAALAEQLVAAILALPFTASPQSLDANQPDCGVQFRTPMLGNGHLDAPSFPLSSSFSNGTAKARRSGLWAQACSLAHLEFNSESKLRVPT
jgi:hypothetical protein